MLKFCILLNPHSLGMYSHARPEQCQELQFLNRDKHTLAGAFNTPSLRNISKIFPYIHDGRYNNLKKALKHYANYNKEKALETDLPPIELDKTEQGDIVNFLLTL